MGVPGRNAAGVVLRDARRGRIGERARGLIAKDASGRS
jgi:hypothetical protein